MRISTEGLGGQWSESFNLDNLGTKVRVVECKGDKVILFIRIKQLSNVQKQVGEIDYNLLFHIVYLQWILTLGVNMLC